MEGFGDSGYVPKNDSKNNSSNGSYGGNGNTDKKKKDNTSSDIPAPIIPAYVPPVFGA